LCAKVDCEREKATNKKRAVVEAEIPAITISKIDLATQFLNKVGFIMARFS